MKKIYSILTFTLILLVTGCKQQDLPPNYVGTWMVNGSTLILNKNNTYALTNATALYAGTGTYSTSGTTMTFKDASGVCSDSTIGSYNFNYAVISKTGTFFQQLTLIVLTDTCTKRATVLPGTYTIVN